MKTLLIPLDSHKHRLDDRMFGDMLRAFNKDDEAMMYNDDVNEAIAFKPDVVFYQGGVNKDICEAIKLATECYWITWTGDVRYAPMEHLVQAIEFTDLFAVPFNDTELLKTYERLLGKPCAYVFEPFQNWKFVEPRQLNEGSVTFIGNTYSNLPGGDQRIDLQDFLSKHGVYTEFRGSGFVHGQISNFEAPQFYNESYAVICENNWHDIGGYFTPRNLNAMSAGSCALMKVFPGIEYHFTNWENCIYYRHKYELLDVIDFLKKNPDVRNRIARAGYEYVKANYSFDNFVQQFKKLI